MTSGRKVSFIETSSSSSLDIHLKDDTNSSQDKRSRRTSLLVQTPWVRFYLYLIIYLNLIIYYFF